MNWPSLIPLVWIIAGILLILLEFVLPGFIVIFFGIGALVTGLALFLGLPDSYGLPFIVFSAVSLGSLLLLRRQFAAVFKGNADNANSADEDIIGKAARVVSWESGPHGSGKVEFRGSTWTANAKETFAPGDHVRITGRNGIALVVEREA